MLPLAERKFRHGGRRRNAGRKSASGRSPVRRVRRPEFGAKHPVHVNWRVLPHVWNLRSRRSFRAILRAFSGAAGRFGTRVTHFSVMGNHHALPGSKMLGQIDSVVVDLSRARR